MPTQRTYFRVDGAVGESILTFIGVMGITERRWQHRNLLAESIGKGTHPLYRCQEKEIYYGVLLLIYTRVVVQWSGESTCFETKKNPMKSQISFWLVR